MVTSLANTNVLSSDKQKITGANRQVMGEPQPAEPMIAMLARNRTPRSRAMTTFSGPTSRRPDQLDWGNDHNDAEFPLPRLVGLPAVSHAPAHPMARVGPGGLRHRAARKQAHAARHRGGVVSLVPCDGSR